VKKNSDGPKMDIKSQYTQYRQIGTGDTQYGQDIEDKGYCLVAHREIIQSDLRIEQHSSTKV